MNKTIIININGTVFHIEEQAYEILKAYMTAVKRHFFDSEDSLEITTDIENRVAELFTEILAREGRQAIIDQDVHAVIEQMGAVEDFDNAPTGATAGDSYYQTHTSQRRLFRDPDDHLVGGVCAGIANYFDAPAVWVRLAFALSVIFAGTGFFLYIILWIVLPKAQTRADRMAMKGEKLDLQGFKRNFEAEAVNLRERLNEAGHHAKPFIYRFRDFLGEFFGFLGKAIGQSGNLLLKLIGIAFMLSFFCMAIAVIVAYISFMMFGHTELQFIFPFSVLGVQYNTALYTSAFFAIIIPLVILIVLFARLAFNTARLSSSALTVLGVLWVCAVTLSIYYAARISANFRYSASFGKTVNIAATKNNVYHLKLNDKKYLTAEDSARLNVQSRFHGFIVIDGDEDDMGEPNNVSISVEKSDVAQPTLFERFSANGATYDQALMNARNTVYNFTQKDSVLTFDRSLHRNYNEQWHNQEILLVLKVPVNSTVLVDKNLNRPLSLNIWGCLDDNKTPDATYATFKMQPTGLECKVDTLKRDTVRVTDTVKVFAKPTVAPKHLKKVK
ncbi:PspC domain-containing protein [Mucilaginibacter ginkgonis]|uniref:PspC domain-containing protein n=1 Tax=Mucilaginibacter ginkgonis TaxID=2682091 RepID=A0A6I4INQ5_9SPHI|nr:PspC domain-containing protein [Mucilaginibacter ginkgonis]QQL49012.1 PspC domain-containing protein [Mucilaginibacter ginkgonis]